VCGQINKMVRSVVFEYRINSLVICLIMI